MRGTPPPPPPPPQVLGGRVVVLVDLNGQQSKGSIKEDKEEAYSYKWLLDSVGSMRVRDLDQYKV